MERYQRHRYALALPFVLFAVVAFAGGILNGVTATGRLVDDYTDEGVKDAELSVGLRKARSAEDGTFVMPNVPRTTSIRVDAGGYFRTSAPPDASEIRLAPNSVTVQVNVEGTDPPTGIDGAQIRQGTRVLGTVNQSGNTVITPHPGRDAKILICAKGFESREVTVRGVLLFVALPRERTDDCPPLPTPTPNPNATPTPPRAPATTPGASPLPSPSR